MGNATMPLSILEELLWQQKLDIVTEEANERQSKKEEELPSEQKVEGNETQDSCEAERDRPDNPKETVEAGKPASQKSKGRRVRKPE